MCKVCSFSLHRIQNPKVKVKLKVIYTQIPIVIVIVAFVLIHRFK